MAPKAARKNVAEATPSKAAPKKETPKATPSKETSKKPDTPKTPAKKKEPMKFTALPRDAGAPLPIDVTFCGDIIEAQQIKSGSFVHQLKLEAAAPFTLVKAYIIPEGQPMAGRQVILLKPAKAFQFMKLSQEIRQRIYKFYFAAKGVTTRAISIDTKRKGTTDWYAKGYADGSKNRIGLLAINKEIHTEAVPILYAKKMVFDSTSVLLDFMGTLDSSMRSLLRDVEVKSYIKASARNALAFLAEAKNLQRIKFVAGVVMEEDVEKAAKGFWSDASKLLQAVGSVKEKAVVREAIEDGDDDDEEEEEEVEQERIDTALATDAPEATDMTEYGDVQNKEGEAETIKDANDTLNTANGEITKPTREEAVIKKKTPKPKFTERQGLKSDAVDILIFGTNAFQYKDEDKKICAWGDEDEKEQFFEILRGKLNASLFATWACVCGSMVVRHSCAEEMSAKRLSKDCEKVMSKEFEHLGHGGAAMLNEICAT